MEGKLPCLDQKAGSLICEQMRVEILVKLCGGIVLTAKDASETFDSQGRSVERLLLIAIRTGLENAGYPTSIQFEFGQISALPSVARDRSIDGLNRSVDFDIEQLPEDIRF